MRNKIVLSIVSHGHESLIIQNKFIQDYVTDDNFILVIKDNLHSSELEFFCIRHSIDYIFNQKPKGFGENNNDIFKFVQKKYSFDTFICMNPDVFVSKRTLFLFNDNFQTSDSPIATINLYKDFDYSTYDYAIRKFPGFIDFFSSFLLGRNKTLLDKSTITEPVDVDWAAGSFLAFKKKSYESLNGFDLKYFMYCEDLDICWRSKKLFNQSVLYFPQFKGVHFAAHKNKNIFSKHFVWHVTSMFKYLLQKGFRNDNIN